MYLAGILALCALLHVSAFAHVRGESSGTTSANSAQKDRTQEPTKPDTASEPSTLELPKQDKAPTGPPPAQPQQEPPSPPPAASAPADTPATAPPPSSEPKAAGPAKKTSAKKKHAAKTNGEEPQKRVIHRGGTVEPTTQLTPGMTEEQAARQRQNMNQLLATTDASLQKLSGRQLTKDEQDTVSQIRRFMRQAKAADADGDLQRAYKVAVKARLLSDALAKP